MDKKWQDLVPFYVANTLNEQERADFESYMATDPACQQAVQEWQVIAAATWAEVETHQAQLPPLSQRVKTHIQAHAVSSNGRSQSATATVPMTAVYRRPQSLKTERRSSAPLTMAAALLAMILFGGLFVFLAFGRPNGNSQFASGELTQTADSMEVAAANTVSPTPTRGDGGILPTVTPLPPDITPFSLPTVTPITQTLPFDPIGTPTQPINAMIPIEGTPNAVGTIAPVVVCTVRNPLTSAIGVYVGPGYQYTTAGELAAGEAIRSTVQSDTGWYEVISPEAGIIGWVDGAMVESDEDCNVLPLPTPTLFENDLQRLGTVDVESTPLLLGPGEGYSVHHTLFLGEGVSVIARTPDGLWYLVLPRDDGGQGWVLAEDVVLNDNYQIPLVATVPPPPVMTITATPQPPTQGTGATNQIQAGAWQHDVTVVQHDCGGEIGSVTSVDLTMEPTIDEGGIRVIYTATQTSFDLRRIGDNVYSGSYSTSADIAVSLTFTTPTTYTANETIVHESGCIVRMEWVGRYVGA